MRVLGVNGIYNFSWGKDSFTDRFLAALKNKHEVIDVKYPMMTVLAAYSNWSINRRAKKIVEQNKPGDCVIAHSFGCLLTLRAMELGAKFDKVFFFGAAAEQDVVFPEGAFNRLYNVYSEDDGALFLGNLVPFHRFGELGKYGYEGNDERVVNINASGNTHNSITEREHFCDWVNFIRSEIE